VALVFWLRSNHNDESPVAIEAKTLPGSRILRLLPPREGNPRNSEGAFLTLKNGRILFAYTKFTGGVGDHDEAVIAARYSSDGGMTWNQEDRILVPSEGLMNVMSVSLLRLPDERIALFYLRKDAAYDCVPYVRYSSDEGVTWSEPIRAVFEPAYWVLNNDRVVQHSSGRLIMPLGRHGRIGDRYNPRSQAVVFYSDDTGATWKGSGTRLTCPTDSPRGFQEPGVVELQHGRLMMFIRTNLGSLYLSYSEDRGETWSEAEPSQLLTPLAPASMKRIPSTGDLLLVWNDHSNVPADWRPDESVKPIREGRRTPLAMAISRDDGKTWGPSVNLMDHPDGWYCYTAIHFVEDHVLLGYVSGGVGLPGLSKTDIAHIPVESIYAATKGSTAAATQH
jgi:sialidase-1